MPITHSKVSTLSNNGDPNLVQPSDWNAAHNISGVLDFSGATALIFGLLPNTALAFSATPVFSVATNISYSMLLTGSVISSTTSGSPLNGQLLSLTLTQDAIGGRSFAFPANFVLPPNFVFDTTANHINELTFKFDGTNWHLIANSGGAGGGGANPAGNQGDLQSKNGSNLQASSLNDNGSRVLVSNDAHFKGPNPYIDVTSFGVRATSNSLTTTCTTTGGSANVTIGSASTYVNGDGVVCRGAGANFTLSTPAAPTVTSSNASGLLGTGVTVPNASGGTTYNYCVVVRDIGGGYSPCSPVGSTTTGAATLGAVTVAISSYTVSNNTVTVTTSAAHNLTNGALIKITGEENINGWFQVATATPGTTTFTFLYGKDTRSGGVTSVNPSTASVTTWVGNHITWAHVANAWQYLIYKGVGGALVGVSLIDNTGLNTDPTYNEFDDWGSPITTAPNQPDWVPTTAPTVAKNDDLVTTIVSGAGTTSLVLNNTATNAVASATFKLDNTPNFVAALASFNSTQRGVLFIPVGVGNSAYFTNSVMTLIPAGGVALPVMQAGSVVLGDTLQLGQTYWEGNPKNPVANISFGWDQLPTISSSVAVPMIYSAGQVRMHYMLLRHDSPNAGIIWHYDGVGNIPAGQLDHVQFGTSGTADFSSQHLLVRNNVNKDGNFGMSYVNFVSGPLITDLVATPLFQATQAFAPATMDHIMMNRRGLYIGAATTGIQLKIDSIYCQGCAMPKITLANTAGGGLTSVSMDITLSIEDTSTNPLLTYFNGTTMQGLVRIYHTNGLQNAIVTGSGNLQIETGYGGDIGQNFNVDKRSPAGSALDGILSTGGGVYSSRYFGLGVHTGPAYQFAVESVTQPAPTCVVSAGGSVTVGSYTFQVAPVFALAGLAAGGEGPLSPSSATCTTSGGNQTITISWTAVPGVIGYNLYKNGFSFQCAAPWVTGNNLSYVFSANTGCGIGTPAFAGSGPTNLSSKGVATPEVRFAATDGTNQAKIVFPTGTALRTLTIPDASGQIALSPVGAGGLSNFHFPISNSAGELIDGTNPMPVADDFKRASAAIEVGNPNWTKFVGTSLLADGTSAFSLNCGANCWYLYNGQTFASPHQMASITFASLTSAGLLGVAVRGGGGNGTGYTCDINNGGSATATLTLRRWDNVSANTQTVLSSVAYSTLAVGDVLTIEANQGNLTCYVNNVSKLTASDSTYTTGFPGLVGNNTTVNYKATNFLASYGGVSLNAAQTWSPLQTFTTGVSLNGSNTLSSVSGNSGKVGQTSGTLTNGDLVSIDASGNLVDSGLAAASITTKLSSITAATGANSINNGDNAQTWNWALVSAAKTAFKFTENTAAISGGSSQFLTQIGTLAGSTAVPLNVFNSLTGSQTLPALSITPTWNTSGVVDAALLVNPVNTASGTGSLLADFQLGNTSQWKVDKAGNTTQLGSAALGSIPPNCTPGTAGGSCVQEGTAPSAGVTYDTLYADSTQHALSVNNNNTGNMVLSRVACVNITPVTVNTSTTSDQNLMSCTLSANLLNVVGRTLRVWTAALYGTPAASVATVNTKLKLCTVSGCGSGTAITLASFTSTANPGTVTNNSINSESFVTTQTAGAASAYEAHGNMTIDLSASPGLADSTFSDVNTTTVGTIDSTVQLFLQVTGAFNVASGSNSMSQRQLIVEVLN